MLANQMPEGIALYQQVRGSVSWESRCTLIRTRVKSPARELKASTILVLSAISPLLL